MNERTIKIDESGCNSRVCRHHRSCHRRHHQAVFKGGTRINYLPQNDSLQNFSSLHLKYWSLSSPEAFCHAQNMPERRFRPGSVPDPSESEGAYNAVPYSLFSGGRDAFPYSLAPETRLAPYSQSLWRLFSMNPSTVFLCLLPWLLLLMLVVSFRC